MAAPEVPGPPVSPSDSARPRFSQKILNIGFVTALGLATVCLLLSGYYMISFQTSANMAVKRVLEQGESNQVPGQAAERLYRYQTNRLALTVHMYIARVLLPSCGIFVGLAFGFLGFSLFLIGVNGEVDVRLDTSTKIQLQVTRLAPGIFVGLPEVVWVD